MELWKIEIEGLYSLDPDNPIMVPVRGPGEKNGGSAPQLQQSKTAGIPMLDKKSVDFWEETQSLNTTVRGNDGSTDDDSDDDRIREVDTKEDGTSYTELAGVLRMSMPLKERQVTHKVERLEMSKST